MFYAVPRSLYSEKTKRNEACILITHLERSRDSQFKRDCLTMKDASGSEPIEFEFEDVQQEDVTAYFRELEGKIEESPTTYLVAVTAWRTLCEGIERDNNGCVDDILTRTRICARLSDVIFLDERLFAHSQNNICASRENAYLTKAHYPLNNRCFGLHAHHHIMDRERFYTFAYRY